MAGTNRLKATTRVWLDLRRWLVGLNKLGRELSQDLALSARDDTSKHGVASGMRGRDFCAALHLVWAAALAGSTGHQNNDIR